MKKLLLFITVISFMMAGSEGMAQLKNMDVRIGDKVKRKIDQKADRTIDKALNKGEKEIDEEVNETVKGNKRAKKKKEIEEASSANKTTNSDNEDRSSNPVNSEPAFNAYSKFDFIPGEKIIFYDDFTQDSPGDFPSKWDANGSGEVVSTDSGDKLFELKGGAFYLPQITGTLPENYTLEFDVKTSQLDDKLSSTSHLQIILDDNSSFNLGRNFARVELPFCQYNAGSIHVVSRANGKEIIDNRLIEDIRKKMKAGTHISVAVNKKRFRLWMDEQKVVDVPSLVPDNIQNIKLSMTGFANDFKNYHFYINNIKIAEGTNDLRSQLITDGKFVTSGILFDTNSDDIKPGSHGTLKEIARVLSENEAVKIKIVGHTDSDGDEKSNLDLSKRRALSVKQILTQEFNISEDRIETDGKGESEPIDKSNSLESKANNRRVEFLKI